MDFKFLETFNFVVCSPKALSGHQKHDSVERITLNFETRQNMLFSFFMNKDWKSTRRRFLKGNKDIL